MSLDSHIEALLFWKNETVTISWLSKILEKNTEEINEALNILERKLEGRGIVLQRSGEEIALKTHADISELVSKLSKEEMVKELTPSALETLSIIIYRGPLPKKEIDYIRGVNSGFILRNLLIRGLIERNESKEGRGIYYTPSLDLLSLLGVSKLEDLEEYENVKKEIEDFKKNEVESTDNA